jgi:hypothetical protein
MALAYEDLRLVPKNALARASDAAALDTPNLPFLSTVLVISTWQN